MADQVSSYDGPTKLLFCRRLIGSWMDLADLLEIPPHVRHGFPPGDEARSLWEWLEAQGGLHLLASALDEVDRPDLALELRMAESPTAIRPGFGKPAVAADQHHALKAQWRKPQSVGVRSLLRRPSVSLRRLRLWLSCLPRDKTVALLAAGAATVTAVWIYVPGYFSASEPASVPLTIGLYADGHSFPERILRQYEREHPGIKVTSETSPYATYENNLEKSIAAGEGANDLQVVELPYMSRFAAQPAHFVNLRPDASSADKAIPASLAVATASDGSAIGLPIDLGGMAICYRKDLFAQAGLPSSRRAVSAMFNTWTDYIEAGHRFTAHTNPGTFWFDSSIHLLNGILGSEPASAVGDPATFDAATSPAVKKAWDLTVTAIQAKESAKVVESTFQEAVRSGRFATITCPAWMLGQIKRAAGDQAGLWDLARGPGGSGNWSGSFVTVPSQGKHAKAAAELARWLVEPDQQVAIFTDFGHFPSAPSIWRSPLIQDYQDPYFSDAPVGKIIAGSLESAKPSAFYNLSGLIATAAQPQLSQLERGRSSAAMAWLKAQKSILLATRGQ